MFLYFFFQDIVGLYYLACTKSATGFRIFFVRTDVSFT
jgi:hypothetical protein